MRIRRSQVFLCVFAYNFCMKIFCERFKELRKEKNISTTELGKVLNVNGSTITRWENGIIIPSIDHLLNIAKYFDVSADYLIGLTDF